MIIVGVNGGGTKTVALAYNSDGVFIGSGRSGSANIHNINKKDIIKHVKEAIEKTGVKARIDVACIAVAGIDTEKDRKAAKLMFKNIARKVIVEQDSFAELYAETRGGDGVIAVAGTGSSVIGIKGKHRFRASGAGWLLSDNGSAYAIGREGLRKAFEILNANNNTILSKAIFLYLKLKTLDELIEWAFKNSTNIKEIASIARVVDKAAMEGDKDALSIIKKASRELASYAVKIAGKVEVNKIFCTGSVFNSSIYYKEFSNYMKKYNIRIIITNKSHALGPLYIAADQAGIKNFIVKNEQK
ncbi:MAG: BadF/BadG/BcrA/BcrD ATPase family protein [Candidatus Micrarchaeia archaeon]